MYLDVADERSNIHTYIDTYFLYQRHIVRSTVLLPDEVCKIQPIELGIVVTPDQAFQILSGQSAAVVFPARRRRLGLTTI